MTDHSTLMMLVIMVVTFIAGYSVVGYAVRKFKEGAARQPPPDRNPGEPDSTLDNTSPPPEFRDRH